MKNIFEFQKELRKKFPKIDKSYFNRLKQLDSAQLNILTLELLDITELAELDKYL